MKHKLFWALACMCSSLLMNSCSCCGKDATKADSEPKLDDLYAVVVSAETYAKDDWKKVADALVSKHKAQLVTFEKNNIDQAYAALKISRPHYIAFVREPDQLGVNFTATIQRVVRAIDSDPYGDALYGIITGYTAADALRMAQATKPTKISTAMLTTDIGHERFKETYFISDGGTNGLHGYRGADGKEVSKATPGVNMAPYFVDCVNKGNPDIIITSSHASQRNLEMPHSAGNIVPRNGHLYGSSSNQQLINYATGQAINIKPDENGLLPITSTNPKIFFAQGNCLIGDAPDKEAMCVAAISGLNCSQFFGYTFTCWFGPLGQGFGTLFFLEQGGGHTSFTDANFFGNQRIIARLEKIAPGLGDFKYTIRGGREPDHYAMLNEAKKKLTFDSIHDRNVIGLLWDRDGTAFYGDPKLRSYLDKDYTVKPNKLGKLTRKGNEYTYTIEAFDNVDVPGDWSSVMGDYLPSRIDPATIKVLDGQAYEPVITDDFIMVTRPGPFKKGEKATIRFTAELLKK